MAQDEKKCDLSQKEEKKVRQKGNKVEVKRRDSSSSGSETVGLVVEHVLSADASGRLDSWVMDSRATYHV